jgi:hypothetical protein
MSANIAQDIVIRATVKNDTASGARSVQQSARDMERQAREAQKTAERQAREQQRLEEVRARRVMLRDRLQMERDFARTALTDSDLRREQASRLGAGGGQGSGGSGGGVGGGFLEAVANKGLGGAVTDKLGMAMAVAGVAAIGAAFERVGQAAEQAMTKLRSGEQDAAGMVNELSQGVPVLGDFVKGFNSIREAITGERYQIELTREATASIEAHNERILALSIRNREAYAAQRAELEAMARANAAIGLRGAPAERQAIANAAQDTRDELKLQRQRAKDEAATDPEVKKAQQELQNFTTKNNDRISQLEETIATWKNSTLPEASKRRGIEKAEEELRPLKEAEARLKSQLAQTTAKRDEKKKGDLDYLDGKEKLVNDREKRQMTEFEKLNSERKAAERAAAKSESELSQGSTAAAKSRVEGDVVQADLKDQVSRQKAEEDRAKADALARSLATTDANEKAEIASRLQQKLTDIEQAGIAEREAIRKRYRQEQARATFDADQAEKDAQAAAIAENLRRSGKGYEAARQLAEREYSRRRAEIDQRANEAIAQNRNNEAQIRKQAEAEKRKVTAEENETKRQMRESEIQGRTGTAQELVRNQVDALEGEARMGNFAAAAEAKRLKIASEYAAKRAEINKLIRDPNVGEAEKRVAEQQLKNLDVAEKRAQMLAGFVGGGGGPSTLVMSRGTGAARRATEEASTAVQMVKYAEKSAKHLEDILKSQQELVATIQKDPILQTIFRLNKPGGR